MIRIILLCWCLFALSLAYLSANKIESSDLMLTHILYRHGDRSPQRSYPTDPYNESAWPQGFGQLSTVGMNEQYALGQYLRKRYIEGQPYKLLHEFYDRFQVYVRSTDFDRTLMSAECNLAGLFPPQGSQVWNNDLLWQPIPVHTVPKQSDYLLNVGEGCVKYDEELLKVFLSDPVQEMERRNKEFYEFVGNASGIENFFIGEMWIADTLFCEKTHNLSLPSWVNTTWDGVTTYDKLLELQDTAVTLQYNSTVLSRLTGGPLVGEMVQHMKDKRDGKLSPQQKAFIYSAHDSTISSFLSALKVFNGRQPLYTSTVLVDLFNTSGKFFVEIWYRNESSIDAEPFKLIIPGCDASCPLDTFVELTKSVIPSDWHAECNTTSPSSAAKMTTKTQLWTLAVVLILLAMSAHSLQCLLGA